MSVKKKNVNQQVFTEKNINFAKVKAFSGFLCLVFLKNKKFCVMANKKKVLFVMQEITPYVPETFMSKVGRILPQGIQEKGKEIRVFMPRYGIIKERRHQLHEVIRLSGMNVIVNDTDHSLIIKVASIPSARMQIYFIDNEDYFHRKAMVKDENGNFFKDNDERIIFFSRGVLETVKKLRWEPDIVNVHGWLGALVPLYVKKAYQEDPIYKHSKVVYTIYDNGFDEPLNKQFKSKAKFDIITDKDLDLVKNPTYQNLTKLAIKYSDAVVLASENIDPEILEFIEKQKKTVLPFVPEEKIVEKYSEFFDNLLA